MKYIITFLLNILGWICEGIYYLIYVIATLLIIIGYTLWNLKFLKNPFKLVNDKLKSLFEIDNKLNRIIIGIVTIGILIYILLLINFLVVTLIISSALIMLVGGAIAAGVDD